MPDTLIYVILVLSLLAALGSMTSVVVGLRQRGVAAPDFAGLMRQEADRLRAAADDQARALREEVGGNIRGVLDSLLTRLDAEVGRIDTRVGGMDMKLDENLRRLGLEATQHRDGLRQVIDMKLEEAVQRQSTTLTTIGDQQKERLEAVNNSLEQQSQKLAAAQEGLRQTVEGRLDTLRTENAAKLEEIRKTVDEELQKTLNERITGSFKVVQEQLEQVYRGLGEMQKLADGVGDLKRVLSNVKTRGIFGEVQLGALIEQMFSPGQYVENAQVRPHSQERVEFAIKLPGRSGEGDVLIPIDAKFPIDDYDRLVSASERGDATALEEAANQLHSRILLFAKEIGLKYVNPPVTTEFAILFLPTEGLYAEVLRRGGLVESLFEKHRVFVCGPTNLLAMLNAFRMSIRAVAIQQRSTEVWQVLGAVRAEFNRHGDVLKKLERQLQSSLTTVDSLGTRTRQMQKKLQGVETMGDQSIADVLGLPVRVEEEEAEEAEPADHTAA